LFEVAARYKSIYLDKTFYLYKKIELMVLSF